MLDPDFVISTHDEIIARSGGLAGLAQAGHGGVEAALHRIAQHVHYAGLDNVFGIASLYGVAIARGHIFNDGNKRTGLTCTLAYLEQEGFHMPACAAFEEVMVEIALGKLGPSEFAVFLYSAWHQSQTARVGQPSFPQSEAVEPAPKPTKTSGMRRSRR
ncbi:type II toxin-antitoxin system death-on-curing family toxin [Comamonas endophytica]|uniref:Type II toxin-antitoxin system death-on-curing family toxin n=1 Tax=Comamonas endophytica TaxID=2949090 RepID=A0ABY6GBN6_9BURK|nr:MULTISPECIES: type II toxin-antitoxin system death-on-curing family toxin [unclassified Acidovorax]MCD2512175.1 type II toxin-antitoxin system death-on-curing family toxin [Acidovorax sp. D4N7]UYG51947.1 type II toxin-antitoxin system death-on-curing family toxin [Acidovorax sp. 5MLIR]